MNLSVLGADGLTNASLVIKLRETPRESEMRGNHRERGKEVEEEAEMFVILVHPIFSLILVPSTSQCMTASRTTGEGNFFQPESRIPSLVTYQEPHARGGQWMWLFVLCTIRCQAKVSSLLQ